MSQSICSSDNSSISSDFDDSCSNYTKVSHEEHVQLVPDTYVGSVESEQVKRYVHLFTEDNNGEGIIIEKNISIVPACYKIFDEVLTNASDHWKRLLTFKEDGIPVKDLVKEIRVNLDKDNGVISVENDGDGIDVIYLDEYQMYAPELIFGSLLTGTNYDKEKKRKKTWGGRNGYGAKLANIFSTSFKVNTIDAKRNLEFNQVFEGNMKIRGEPEIKPNNGNAKTKITFLPDYKNSFGMDCLDEEHMSLFRLRVYDIAAWVGPSVKVYLNDNLITINTFEKYVNLYLNDKEKSDRVYCRINNRFEIIATDSPDDNFQQVSLVNAINTCRGGKHVDCIVDQIKDQLSEFIKKKKKIDIKPSIVKNQLYLFVKCVIDNPSFDSQTKETLTTPRRSFGTNPILDQKFIEKLYKTPIVDKIISEAEYKSKKSVKKNDGRKLKKIIGIPKLCDANKAGGKSSKECTLILTEGDSAKTTAVAGLSVVGRDLWGVFPLRGKLLNVKDINIAKVFKNEEIQNIVKILGLKNEMTYDKKKQDWPLRYGRILIMTDQDLDGTHIKGLVINLFHTYWPSLLKDDFITSMITPIVKASKNKKKINFYNLFDYEQWKNNDNAKGFKIKYYKGLGTSNTTEAKDYFRELKIQSYMYEDGESNKSLNLAFDKTMAINRKSWLRDYEESNVLDYNKKRVSYTDFINKDLIHFSEADCKRSIPKIQDGFKPAQRKILYGILKKKSRDEIKVAQLSGYIAEVSCYHHGEMSLNSTIISLAQNFVGSNNINLLYPSGQFGSRILGGKDASSPRYIYTKLSDITKLLFREEDLDILDYLDDDGYSIEPRYYLPIIPMLLINGTRGIGTGYSTNVPCFNPSEIITCLKKKINGEEISPLKPWYRGFKGEIVLEKGSHVTKGTYEILGAYEIRISELPIGTWTQNYKEYLDTCVKDRNNTITKKTFLKSYDEYFTESTVDFKLKLLKPYVDYTKLQLEDLLKMKTSTETNMKNMVLYNNNGVLQKFKDTTEIINDFYEARLEGYKKRKISQIEKLTLEKNILEDRVKFIKLILDGTLDLRNKTKLYIECELSANGLRKLINDNFDYLIDMKMSSQTKEKVEELNKKYEDKEKELNLVIDMSEKDRWLLEIKEIEDFIKKEEKAEKKEALKKKSKGKKKK